MRVSIGVRAGGKSQKEKEKERWGSYVRMDASGQLEQCEGVGGGGEKTKKVRWGGWDLEGRLKPADVTDTRFITL